MGMFDTIYNVPVKCPRCGDAGPKSVQIKSGPQNLNEYEFGKDEIPINWTYEYYGSVIDRKKRIIRGIATCGKCKEESKKKMDELIQEANDKKEIKIPEGEGEREGEMHRYLFECEIDGKDALKVMLNRLDEAYGGNRNIELFEVAIFLNVYYMPIAADPITDMNEIRNT